MAATLSELNVKLFRELDRLEAVDITDKEMRDGEIERSKAIVSVGGVAIENAKTMMLAIRMQREAEMGVAGAVAVPRGLLGE